MKYGVNRQILLIIAGTVWIIAGGNILRIGIVTWMNNSHDWMFKIGEATIVFLLLFVLIFKRLYYKPESFISVFYTGLSIALILTGILFIRYWWLKRKTMLN